MGTAKTNVGWPWWWVIFFETGLCFEIIFQVLLMIIWILNLVRVPMWIQAVQRHCLAKCGILVETLQTVATVKYPIRNKYVFLIRKRVSKTTEDMNHFHIIPYHMDHIMCCIWYCQNSTDKFHNKLFSSVKLKAVNWRDKVTCHLKHDMLLVIHFRILRHKFLFASIGGQLTVAIR